MNKQAEVKMEAEVKLEVALKAKVKQIGLAEAIAAHAFGIAPKDLRAGSEARAVATYLAQRVLRLAGLSGAASARRRVEARRRDPQFDRVMVQLETLLRSAVTA